MAQTCEGYSVTETTQQTPIAEDFDSLSQILAKANDGSMEAILELRSFLDKNPQVWQQIGDAALIADQAWINKMFKGSKIGAESLKRVLDQLRTKLLGESENMVEKMLVDTVVSTWLEMHYLRSVDAENADRTAALTTELLKRTESAQRRHSSAMRDLVQIRKLLLGSAALAPLRVFLPSKSG